MTISPKNMYYKIMKYYRMLFDNKKHKQLYIKADNKYERLCIYKALELYTFHNNTTIWSQRKKEYVTLQATNYVCKKHPNIPLLVCDNYEGDYECQYCPDDSLYYIAYPGDDLYKSKLTIGLTIFYEKPNFKCKEWSINKIKNNKKINFNK
jgi:hypothetical protein